MKGWCLFLPITVFLLVCSVVACQDDSCFEFLQERIDCFDTDGPCENLPIPQSAFGDIQPDPSKGYFIQTLRQGIYAVSDGSYFLIVAVGKMGRGGGRKKKNRGSKLRSLESGSFESQSKKKGKKQGPSTNSYQVTIIDFPEGNFVIRDETGQVVGSRVTAALDEIVFDLHGLNPENVAKVQMVYSHAHFDHIGAATLTYSHIPANWGSTTDIDVIGHLGVLEEFEERITANFFSFRAPLPTIAVNEERVFFVGEEFSYSLTPENGHSEERDLVVFFEKDGKDPAIMMFVDVVFPGWAPFFSLGIASDAFDFLMINEKLLNNYDLGDDGYFVGGHLTNVGSRGRHPSFV